VIAILCITIIGIPLAAAVAIAYRRSRDRVAVGRVVGYRSARPPPLPRFKGGQASLLQAVLWGGVALHALRIAGDLFKVVPVFGSRRAPDVHALRAARDARHARRRCARSRRIPAAPA